VRHANAANSPWDKILPSPSRAMAAVSSLHKGSSWTTRPTRSPPSGSIGVTAAAATAAGVKPRGSVSVIDEASGSAAAADADKGSAGGVDEEATPASALREPGRIVNDVSELADAAAAADNDDDDDDDDDDDGEMA